MIYGPIVNFNAHDDCHADPLLDLSAEPPHAKGMLAKPELRIALTYMLFASLWIIGTDMVLEWYVSALPETVFLHILKGLSFVVATSLLLYWVLHRAFDGWRRSEKHRLAAMRTAGERFRNLSTRIQNLREEERTRISHEIHDELGQLLTGVKIQIRLIEEHLTNREDRSLNPEIEHLVEASAMIDETIAAVRRIASGLRPLALDHLGLAAALDEEAEQFSKRTGIECHLTMGEMRSPIPPEVETAAFRIFQESLTNVARHAEASRIDAKCSTQEEVLTLTVSDDGVGLDPAGDEVPGSLGMIGMLERAADAGGKVEFKGASNQGTQVILTIPLAVASKFAAYNS